MKYVLIKSFLECHTRLSYNFSLLTSKDNTYLTQNVSELHVPSNAVCLALKGKIGPNLEKVIFIPNEVNNGAIELVFVLEGWWQHWPIFCA